MKSHANPSAVRIEDRHLKLISRIYDLPLNPAGWQDVLDDFVPMMGGKVGVVSTQSAYSIEYPSTNFSSSLGDDFLTQFQENVPADYESPFIRMAQSPHRGFIDQCEVLGIDDIEDYKARPMVQWFNKNFGLLHGVASNLNIDKAWTDILYILFDEKYGPATPENRALGNMFLEHFAKASELCRAFGVLQSRFSGTLAALDRYHIGVCLLNARGEVIVKNAEAQRILESADGLSLTREGHLMASEDHHASLKQTVSRAAQTASGDAPNTDRVMVIPRRSGQDSYLLEISALRDDGRLEKKFRGCLALIIDPARTDVVSTDGMQALYGLTQAESDTCRLLAQGLETRDLADARNVTPETVRTTIKQVLQKSGVGNRAQLVRLALRVNLPIDQKE